MARGIIDVYPEREQTRPMLLTTTRMKQVLGMEHSMEQARSVLTSLGFRAMDDGESLSVSAPPWRSDITIEDDLVEEVARIVGYDSIPTEMLSTSIPHYEGQDLRDFRERVRDLLVRQGLQETISYSAVGMDLLRKARVANSDEGLLSVSNPMSREFKYMRPTLRASLRNTLSFNVARDARSVAIFEIGRVYLKQGEDLPDEPEIAAGLLCGQRTTEGWLSTQGSYDFYDAKGIVEALLGALDAQGEFRPQADGFLHPGRRRQYP